LAVKIVDDLLIVLKVDGKDLFDLLDDGVGKLLVERRDDGISGPPVFDFGKTRIGISLFGFFFLYDLDYF
jgi:hypothetical protein